MTTMALNTSEGPGRQRSRRAALTVPRAAAWVCLGALSLGSAVAAPISMAAAPVATPAPTASAPAESAPGGPEELLPVTRADQAVNLYRSVCLSALSDGLAFVDFALARGLQPVVTTDATANAVATAPLAEGELVFATVEESPIEITIRGQQRCAVWVRSDGGPALRRSFERAVNELKAPDFRVQWVMDRTTGQKNAQRRILRAEAVVQVPAVRMRFDAALMASEGRSGLQALSVQVNPIAPPAPAPLAPPATPVAPAASAAEPLPVAPPANPAEGSPPPVPAPAGAGSTPSSS